MKKRVVYSLLCLLLCAALAFPIVSIIADAAGLKQMKTIELADGETYVMAARITPTGLSNAEYAITSTEVATSNGNIRGLGYKVRNGKVTEAEEDSMWLVAKSGSGYTFLSVNQQKYLNISGKDAYLSDTPQTLSVGTKYGYVIVYNKVGGTTAYLNFTNENDLPRWRGASTSTLLNLYRVGDLDQAEYEGENDDPLYVVSCFSDIHVDYGIQGRATPIRPSTVKAVQALRAMGGADVMLVGGDMTSANNRSATWTDSIITKVQQTIYDTLAPAAIDGRVLFVAGNHDSQAAVQAHGKVDSNDYSRFMLAACGEFDDALYKQIGKVNSLLCYRYSFDPIEYLVLNTPYNSDIYAASQLYNEQITWLDKQLRAIGKDKTTIILCHYPVTSFESADPEKGDASAKLISTLKKYPNAIYCYGHIHSTDSLYTWYNTSELVLSDGFTTVGPNTVESSSYITVHMGSMGYYNTKFQPGGLTADDPEIVQFMMIYFYKDHITFRMINTGKKSADDEVYDMGSFTVMRDLSAQFGLAPANPTGETDDGDKTGAYLVTKDTIDTVLYDASASVRNVTFGSDAVTLTSYSSSLTGASLKSGMALSLRNVTSGDDYTALAEKLDEVVTQHVAYQFAVKNGSTETSPAGPLKAQLRVPSDFGDDADQITYAVYYLTDDGALAMTDTVEDGGKLTFVLPSNRVFAVSARANVAGAELPGDTDTTDVNADDEGLSTGVLIAILIAVVIIAAAGVFCAYWFLLRKKPAGTKGK